MLQLSPMPCRFPGQPLVCLEEKESLLPEPGPPCLPWHCKQGFQLAMTRALGHRLLGDFGVSPEPSGALSQGMGFKGRACQLQPANRHSCRLQLLQLLAADGAVRCRTSGPSVISCSPVPIRLSFLLQ